MRNNQHIFINKLDQFIRKYYQNQLVKGSIISVLLLAVYFLTLFLAEYFFYFSVEVKTILLITTIIILLFVFVRWIFLPIAGLLQTGKMISHRQAIQIIGQHFPEQEDQLINTLELTQLSKLDSQHKNSLLLASINQRIENIQLIPFGQAISFKDSFSYLKYVLLLLGVIFTIYFIIPDFYASSTTRLIHFRKEYTPPADFSFYIENENLEVVRGDDFEINIFTRGKYYPAQTYIVIDGNQFLMQQKGSGKFSYPFRNVSSEQKFYFLSGDVRSKKYQFRILSKPSVSGFELKIMPPKYTNLKIRREKNLGDVNVPEGSVLEWNIEGDNAEELEIFFSDSLKVPIKRSQDSYFKVSRQIFIRVGYELYLSNNQFKNEKFAKYNIEVDSDLYPQIEISTIQDSTISSAYYFKGIIKDDYGFSKLNFVFSNGKDLPTYIPISIKRNLIHQEFYFAVDFSNYNLPEGSLVNYYFEISDNDAINGSKTSRSQQFSYYIPDLNQIYDLNSNVQDSITSQIEKGIELSKQIQNDILKIQQNAINNDSEKWQQEQLMHQIAEKKNQLDDLLKKIQKENEQKNQMMNAMDQQDSTLLEKQKQIDELLKNVMDEELQKLFDEFNKLSEDFNSKDINKRGNQLKMSFDDFQKQMDRNLQLLQRYEIEVKMNQLVDRIHQMAEENEKDAKEIRKKPEATKDKLEKNQKKWNDLKDDLADLFQKNEEIERPFDIEDSQLDQEEISDLLKETKDFMERGKSGKAGKNLQKTSQKQRNLAKKLSESMMSSESAQLSIDIENLIQLLHNLIEFSFQQEEVLYHFKTTDYRNPKFVNHIEEQAILKEEYQLIQDSLYSLSTRSPQIASLIGNKIFDIESLLNEILEDVNHQRRGKATIEQQKVLTESNELANFLSEALKQLMEQMANAMPGDQLGEKKGGKPNMAGLRSQQELFKKMLQNLISEMKNGQNKKDLNKKMGKFLQEQEMFKEKVNKMLQKGEIDNESAKILREVSKMIDEIELDVSNFSINSNTIFRQNRIISRLLEAENAQMEDKFEKKRESKSGNNLNLSNPKEIFEYKRVRTDFNDVFYKSNIKLFEYYNKLYLDYMINLNND